MQLANWHTFQVLTKRSHRLRDLLRGKLSFVSKASHIWWGVSVEDRKHGLPRVAHLAAAPAANRFLSIEPLLEDLGKVTLAGIGWVIVGGESGPGARAMDRGWVVSLRDQCASASVPFFFKQWGGYPKGRYGRELDRVTHDEMPERGSMPIPPPAVRLARVAEVVDLAAKFPRTAVVKRGGRARLSG